jgi:hypothetical protein
VLKGTGRFDFRKTVIKRQDHSGFEPRFIISAMIAAEGRYLISADRFLTIRSQERHHQLQTVTHKKKVRVLTSALTAMCLLLTITVAREAWCTETESHEYLETIGDTRQIVNWCVEKSDNTRMFWKNENEFSVIQFSGTYASISWEGTNRKDDTTVSAHRQGNTIVLEGTLRGDPIKKTMAIDEAPWYQSLSWSLRRLVLSDDKQTEFWTLRPDTLEKHKMVAKKMGEEEVQIEGVSVPAVRLEVRLKGMLGPFWSSTYWYRKTDGVWLRYEGPSGPPGKPMILIEYRNSTAHCSGLSQLPAAGQLEDDSKNTGS